MFLNAYFTKTYFGDKYFPPTATVTIITRPITIGSSYSGSAGGEYSSEKFMLSQEDEIRQHIKQIENDDQEIVEIIISLIESGILK